MQHLVYFVYVYIANNYFSRRKVDRKFHAIGRSFCHGIVRIRIQLPLVGKNNES